MLVEDLSTLEISLIRNISLMIKLFPVSFSLINENEKSFLHEKKSISFIPINNNDKSLIHETLSLIIRSFNISFSLIN